MANTACIYIYIIVYFLHVFCNIQKFTSYFVTLLVLGEKMSSLKILVKEASFKATSYKIYQAMDTYFAPQCMNVARQHKISGLQ